MQRFGGRQRDFNVVKLGRTRLSFLLYEHFSDHSPLCSPHCPATPCTVGAVSPTTLNGQAPPILHRKELLLPTNHPLVPAAVELT